MGNPPRAPPVLRRGSVPASVPIERCVAWAVLPSVQLRAATAKALARHDSCNTAWIKIARESPLLVACQALIPIRQQRIDQAAPQRRNERGKRGHGEPARKPRRVGTRM